MRRKRRNPEAERAEALRETERRVKEREALDREWAPFDALAARICLEQTLPLIGVDVPAWGQCAEEMTLEGAERRHETIAILARSGVSDVCLRDLVSGSDLYASDRLTAIWWARLRIPPVTDISNVADKDAFVRTLLIRDLDEMVAAGTIHSDARAILRGTEDIFQHNRQRARRELQEFNARLQSMVGKDDHA